MISNNIAQIKKIKEKLNNQKLSTLVGSGFSINVSNMFPTWSSLLYDITEYLYKSEITDSYNIYISSSKTKSKLQLKSKYFGIKINEIIEREGYLEIVSQYIKRKGFRESITTYIEERTPHIIKKGTDIFLKGVDQKKVKEIAITNEILSQHKMLLKLPWNNIFTTNYDTLLEDSRDNLVEEKLNHKIEEFSNLLEQLNNKGNIYNKRFECIKKKEVKINIKIKEIEATENYFFVSKDNSTSKYNEVSLEDINIQKTRVSKVKKTIENEIIFLSQQIKDIESNLVQLNKGLNECLTLVTHSSELKIKRNKNIIKLHGTLRSKKNQKFGFDGDIHKHYVIAKEDYETYPQKHEAFTQLMRISLLQESYVLFGFSGVDPNFIGWISWVRDIIEKRPDANTEDYKIYLIDVSSVEINEEKKLFYENHRIVRLPILEDEIIDFLEAETKINIKNRKNNKEVFELFFYYLSQDVQINDAKLVLESLNKNELNRIWQSIKFPRQKKIDFEKELKKLPILESLHLSLRIPFVNFSYNHNKSSVLNFAHMFLTQIKETDKYSEDLSKLICIAFKDSFLIPNFVWENDMFLEIKNKIKGEYSNYIIDKSIIRESVLNIIENEYIDLTNRLKTNKYVEQDYFEYESILFSAFSFDFNCLYSKLKSWKPKKYRCMNKAGFLALFDSKLSEKYLNEYCLNLEFENQSNQEQLYTLELLRYIRNDITWLYDKQLDNRIKGYKNSGLKAFEDNINNIINDFKKDVKLKPYGDGRFTISNGISLSNDLNIHQKGLQFIQLFIEIGFPLSLNQVYYKNKDEWYLIFKSIFEYFPYPILFYSLQYNDEKFIRRIAQDYSYSKQLEEVNPNIVIKLLNAFQQKNTPNSYKNSILIFLSELFIATSPEVWQSEFYKIWQTLNKENKLYAKRRDNEYNFVIKASPYISDKSIIISIIDNMLKNIENHSHSIIDYLYYLSSNEIYKSLKYTSLTNSIKKQLNLIINLIPECNEESIFILSNLQQVLNKQQKLIIKDKLLQFDFYQIRNEQTWRIILFFAESDKLIQNKIKQAILKSDKLWYSGIHENGVTFGQYNYINLQYINKSKILKNGIIWEKPEAKIIFNLLSNEFNKIKIIKSKRYDINFCDILEEMYHFLINEKGKLTSINNYNEVYNEIEEMYINERNYIELIDGLLSDNNTTVIRALSDMFNKIYYFNKMPTKQDFLALLNKIIFQKEPCLEACISYISNCFPNFKDEKYFKKYSLEIIQILKRYMENELVEFDRPFVEQKLIKLAEVIKFWGTDNEYVAYWLNKSKETKFNNILQNIEE